MFFSTCQWFLIRAVGLSVALSVVPDQGTCGFDLCRTAGDNGVIPSGNPRARTLSTQIPLHVDCRCCGCQTRTSSRVRSGVGGLPPDKVRNAIRAPLPVWIITLAVLFCVARRIKGPRKPRWQRRNRSTHARTLYNQVVLTLPKLKSVKPDASMPPSKLRYAGPPHRRTLVIPCLYKGT